MRIKLVILILLFSSTTLLAQVKLPQIFGDHMVLQRDQPIAIWGRSSPGEQVTVQFNKQTRKARADKNGKWKVTLNPVPAGGPYVLTVRGKNTITFSDVLVGEVWICSGQSNMAWTVQRSMDAKQEIAEANYPRIRHIKIPTAIAATPQDDVSKTNWKVCSPEEVGDFTAVGYFFAREVLKEIDVPIGLINSSWGGTHIEPWTSREAFENSDEFRDMIAAVGEINLDSAQKENERAIVKNIENLQGPLTQAAPAAWKEISFDDQSWPRMAIPGLVERRGVGNVDGTFLFRYAFDVPQQMAGKEARLHLGRIDDADETFVNGVAVGGLSDAQVQRVYTVPAGVLKEGRNVIAIRVEDKAGTGGIAGQPEQIRIEVSGRSIALAGEWSYRVESLTRINGNVSPNQFPTLLFNAMINPLIPYTIRGALWYQGESNVGRAQQYHKAFPLMINDWRNKWALGDFPFYFVQLATYNADNGNSANGSAWAELREAQTATLSLPNTGMAVTTDIGDPNDIHPINKQDVGKRLAAMALNDVYDKKRICSGPVYESMKNEGNKIVLTFSQTGGGLVVKDKYGYLKGFEIAGSDKKFHYAQAYVDGDKVVVFNQNVTDPIAVRFGWADDAGDCNLYNQEGFPAGPFRTDDWKGVTDGVKYAPVSAR